MSSWKARPTTYRGIQVRSRLEASYAAHLDDIGMDWEYEPRAFGSQRGQYLPDFVVHSTLVGDLYLEVKPTVEMAISSLARVSIIRDSIPDAGLLVMVPGVGCYRLDPGKTTWRWFV